ncbi:MAG: radical SAM protein [Candidatus Tectomicrobia bacterium]|uniref:Radical SAM protein n=1 Tax=Tectimicrobiota bacterium TaxID=2528274 RepID=A0A937VZJ2_UNCTE|nr:radical SAM protein [Candidatus Tectomicrobia bacterium]
MVRALTPQQSGFLAGGFTHTLNPYVGCAFGKLGCPFCYVRESPVGRFGPAPWGHWVRQKAQLATALERELRPPASRHYRVFMASATDPYQPLEATACLTQHCLQVMQATPPAWLVVQTRALLVQRDLPLLAALPFVTLNVSIETDLLEVHRHMTRSTAAPARRLALVRAALARGIDTQITVSPMLPSSPNFAVTLAQAVGTRGRVIIDTFLDGDGAGGRRSARLGMAARLTAIGFPDWFAQCRAHAQVLQHRLQRLLGAERVLWSAAGFQQQPEP